MKKFVAGTFCLKNETTYYTNNFLEFFNEKDEKLKEKELENWAVWLNSPWSQAHEKYTIKCNCKDGYTKMDENEPLWKCEYSIIGYDGIKASIFGYGNTENNALLECIMNFKLLQKTYNKEDESV